jgi:hypothetical protein
MTRGSLAPLSPNEETTLRRVALGVSKAATLPKLDVARLTTLALVEEKDGELRLTGVRPERYLALPRNLAVDQSGASADLVSRLAKLMNEMRR